MNKPVIKQFAQNLKYKYKFSSLLFDYFNINRRFRKENKFLKELSGLGASVLFAEELYNNISKEAEKVCHIIGLGWSLNDSIGVIDKNNSFVIGMNNAAISGLKFDLYLMEPGGCTPERTYIQKKIINDLLNLEKERILMKNIYTCEQNKLKYLIDSYVDKLSFIHNIGITCGNEKNLNYWIKKLMYRDIKSIKQYRSTVITAILIAKNAGFKKIVIHGVDFGGEYFYDAEIFKNKESYKPPQNEKYKLYKKSKNTLIHPTANKKMGIQQVLPIFQDRLADKGVSLLCASKKSPLSKILRIYNQTD